MSANTQKICRELSDIKEKSCEMYKENQKCIPTVKSKIVMKTELYKNKKAKDLGVAIISEDTFVEMFGK